jgi:biopolymer transport protein ExbD
VAFGGGGARHGLQAQINITPLVDVVLVLLIIFMVLTPILLKQLDVAVPEKSDVALETAASRAQLVVRVEADGRLALNREPLARAALAERVRAAHAPVVFFDVDDRANYGYAVAVMDDCRGAGARTLGIMSRQ